MDETEWVRVPASDTSRWAVTAGTNLIDAARLASPPGMRPRLRQVTVILKSKDVRAFMNGWPAGRGRLR